VFPSIVGRPILRAEEASVSNVFSGENKVAFKDLIFGDEANKNRALLDISYPMENGIIRNWDDMTKLWEYTFKEQLGVSEYSDHKVLLTEPPLNPKANREKMCEIMFEKFGFSHTYVSVQAVLSLYAKGKMFEVIIPVRRNFCRTDDGCCC
jgi:actin-related protein 2